MLTSWDPLKVSVAVKLNAPASPLKFAFGVKVTMLPFIVNVPSFVLSDVISYVITPAGILLSVVKLTRSIVGQVVQSSIEVKLPFTT